VVVALVDLVIVFGALAFVSLFPVPFLVPYNDEWQRMNVLADHSVWQWMVDHAETWVVRPTAEIILGFASLPNSRPALADAFNAKTFLLRFHLMYYVLAGAFWALWVANAMIVAKSARALPQLTLMFFGVVVCWLMSDELGFGFYWADSYGTILIPFVLLTSGLPLVCSEDWRQAAFGGLLLLAAGLGHEVASIFSAGFLLLAVALRKPTEHASRWRLRAIQAGVLAIVLAVIWVQLFGEGPAIRNEHYLATAGKRYDFASAWLNIREIHPLRAAIATLAPILAISLYRDRLEPTVARAVADFERHRWFWILLAAGTLATAFLPLGSAGLKKGRLAVSYYSVFTYLWFSLLGVVLFPLADRWLERSLRVFRRMVPSVIPVLLLTAAGSGNFTDLRDAVKYWTPLRNEARNYMEVLFAAQFVPNFHVRLCRPPHPYSKPGRIMTDQNEAIYFRIDKVTNRCPRRN
jgi:hypothetical protein